MPPDRRWYRFTIRRALLAVPAVAGLVLLVAGIDPSRRDPMRAAVDRAEAWCAVDVADLEMPEFGGETRAEILRDTARSGHVATPCLLKLGEPGSSTAMPGADTPATTARGPCSGRMAGSRRGTSAP